MVVNHMDRNILCMTILRVSLSAEASTGGTLNIVSAGLGLNISKALAVILGGEITCDSMPGKGTTMTLRIRAQWYEDIAPGDAAIWGGRPRCARSRVKMGWGGPTHQGNTEGKTSSQALFWMRLLALLTYSVKSSRSPCA